MSDPRLHGVDAVVDAARAVDRWGRLHAWCGSDPYDALNASRAPALLERTRFGRRALTQIVKRCPVDLRPLLKIQPARSSAALAWVASAYARDEGWTCDDQARDLTDVLNALMELRVAAFPQPCWGYHFNVQTRVFFYPRGAPNTIATAFAGHAFLDAYDRTADTRWLEVARGVVDFFLARVPATEAPEGIFFGYLVGDRTSIHNASLLVCSLLARVGRRDNRPELTQRAAAGVAYAVARQRQDGSWPYGEGPGLAWVDNFHTGYVLEALMKCRAAGLENAGLDRALEQGLDFYRRHLFRNDGAPKYMPSSLYPIDTQCAAQGIQTFAIASQIDSGYREWARRVAQFALARMRRGDGAFIFQLRRFWRNPTPHVRWCEAPMLLALIHLLRLEHQVGELG